MNIKDLIKHLEAGDAPEYRVVIEVQPPKPRTLVIRLEPYSVRWESGTVVIEVDYES